MVLVYGGSMSDSKVDQGFVDSDYAGYMDTIKYLSGYVFTMFGTSISWKASLQNVVALSISGALKEALWLEGFVKELKFQGQVITIKFDSQSVIHSSKNFLNRQGTKHLDLGCISPGRKSRKEK